MRIVVDLQSCQSGSQKGGIGRYSFDLLRSMVELGTADQFIVVLNKQLSGQGSDLVSNLLKFIPIDNIRLFDNISLTSYMAGHRSRTAAAELVREKFIYDLQPDVVHVTSLIEGLHDNTVTSLKRLDASYPIAVTLYDLIPVQFSESYLDHHITRQHYLEKLDLLRKADLLLSISKYSADEFLHFFPSYQGQITTIKGGIDSKFSFGQSGSTQLQRFKLAKNIDRFVMYTASFDARKNQSNLIKAFAKLTPSLKNSLKLVFVGNGSAEHYRSLERLAQSVGMQADRIVFSGHISDSLLIELYQSCELFVFPSFAEGLGMPILEAMACGAPLIASHATCLPEVVGNPRALFDPANVDGMAELMTQALTDPAFKSELVENGRKHAATYTWKESAEQAMAALHAVARQSGFIANQDLKVETRGRSLMSPLAMQLSPSVDFTDRSKLVDVITNNEIEADVEWLGETRLKVGWVSTWESRCGIAAYSDYLSSGLGVDLIRFAPFNQNREVNPTRNYLTKGWFMGMADDLTDLANEILQSSLDSVVIQVNYGFFNFVALSALIDVLFKAELSVFVFLHSTIDPPSALLPNKLSILAPSLVQVDTVFVHSPFDVIRLSRCGVEQNVSILPHGIVNGFSDIDIPRKTGRLVASYGFFLPNKGIHELIEAASIAQLSGRPFDLLLVNSDYGDEGGVSAKEIQIAKDKVSTFKLEERVTFATDYMDDSRSLELLALADLIVFPYQKTGESSSASVRFGLASGQPVAVTPLSIFEDVNDVVHRLSGVTPEEMELSINELLGEISIESPSILDKAAATARWRARNDYSTISHYLLRKLRQGAARNWHCIAKPEITNLPTQVGAKTVRGIRTNGRAGVMAYGPYVHLPAGIYRIIFSGIAELPLGDECTLSITTEHGQEKIFEETMNGGHGEFTFQRVFFLGSKVSGVEVVVKTGRADIFEITNYELQSR